MIITRRHTLFLMLALCAGAALPAAADTAQFYAPGGVAIGGYDPVAYFSDGQAILGRDEYRVKWRGVIWMFASAEHREAFEMDPAAFAPQYGGYCAVAASEGRAVPSDPRAFAVQDGRLYLNFSDQVLQVWKEDIPGFTSRADLAWLQRSRR